MQNENNTTASSKVGREKAIEFKLKNSNSKFSEYVMTNEEDVQVRKSKLV